MATGLANSAGKTLVRLEMEPEKLLRRMKAKNKKVLYKQGAYLRKVMQRSMRYATKKTPSSKPGEPPRAHKDNPKGPMLRKLITFEVNEAAGSVVCGPTKFGNGDVPRVLNEGGTVRTSAPKAKEQYDVGDFGPIRQGSDSRQSRQIVRGGPKYVRVQLKTAAQVQRAARLSVDFNATQTATVAAHIKPRPFTAPLMSDGGENFKKLIESVPL